MKKGLKTFLGLALALALLGCAALSLADAAGSAVLEFKKKSFEGGQTLPVYSGPGYEYLRANGFAKLSTDETVWMAGRKGDWALVMYQKNGGGFRTGWIDASRLQYSLGGQRLSLESRSATITKACSLTDDPKNRSFDLASLSAGESVTFLASYSDHGEWAYIEVWAGQPICGFVLKENLRIP